MEQITVNATKALEIILPIPADQFCVDQFINDKGQCCVLGHIQRVVAGDPYADMNGFGLRESSHDFLVEKHRIAYSSIVSVNNSPGINGYTEPVIKDRVVHFLKDMQAAGY